jgi:hypothetical protein
MSRPISQFTPQVDGAAVLFQQVPGGIVGGDRSQPASRRPGHWCLHQPGPVPGTGAIRRIKEAREEGRPYPVEGAFLSNDGITALTYANPEGGRPVGEQPDRQPKDLSLFRWRAEEG